MHTNHNSAARAEGPQLRGLEVWSWSDIFSNTTSTRYNDRRMATYTMNPLRKGNVCFLPVERPGATQVRRSMAQNQ